MHLVFDHTTNEGARKAYIKGALTWEDLDDKRIIRERVWNVKASLGRQPY